MSFLKVFSAVLASGLFASQAFAQHLGNPNYDTPTAGDNSTHVATTAFVGAALTVKIPTLGVNQILGNLGGSNVALSVPSCAGASNALTWTLGAGFGCNTIGSGLTTPISPALGGTGVNNGSNTFTTSLPFVITGSGQQTFAFGNSGVPWTYNFPQATATLAYQVGSWVSGNCLQASGTAGGMVTVACPSGGSPGGSTGQVQYNNGGSFGALTNAQLTADINAFTTSLPGAAPASGGGSANFLRADGVWAAPAGTGGGTVNSVGLTMPTFLSVANSPVTSSGTLAVTLATETANTIFAGPTTGSAAAPTFRGLVAADLPLINLSSASAGGVTGTLQAAQEPAHTGDMTNVAGSLATSVTKTGGVAFAPSATTDTTNAANIASGTLAPARLPVATTAALGAVKPDGSTITINNGVISSVGASTSPGGSTGQVQYNTGSGFGGLTNTQLTADINAFTTSLSGATPASGGGTANFLRADGTWAAPGAGPVGMEIDFFYSGVPYANGLLAKTFSRATTVAASAPIKCNAIVGATVSTTVTFARIPAGTSTPTPVGQVVFSAVGGIYQGCTATWTISVSFASGDILTETFPGTADATLANIAISIPAVQ
jgi:hypothetical protein